MKTTPATDNILKPIITGKQVLSLLQPFSRLDWLWIKRHHKFPAPLRYVNGGTALYSTQAVLEWMEYIAQHPEEIGRSFECDKGGE